MLLLGLVLQGIGYGFAAAAQPGPFQTYLISQTLRNGLRRTLIAALAPLVSDGPIIALVLLVLARVPDSLRIGLHLAGGIFILYLARGAWLTWRRFDLTTSAAATPGQQSLWRAALMNALSPGPYLFWSLVTGPLLLQGWRISPVHGIGFLVGFYVTIVATLVAIIVVFSSARRLGPGFNRALIGISAIALAGFGVYQFYQAYRLLALLGIT